MGCLTGEVFLAPVESGDLAFNHRVDFRFAVADAGWVAGALQTATVVAALPFSVILILAIYGLFKSLRDEAITGRQPQPVRVSAPAQPQVGKSDVAAAPGAL
ncbi:hypothetical protein BG841_01990 [Marinobacter sp. X15-166B]|nr:hypothetical protein BG841_01990 [Marinobacter sp. X15-166B]